MVKKFLLITILISNSCSGFCQGINESKIDTYPESIEDVTLFIKNNQYQLFFNDSYQLVWPECATIIRIAQLDSTSGFYYGEFIDFFSDSILLLRGNYTNSLKNGQFVSYYKNSLMKSVGNYVDDNKQGVWLYFYPDGKKMQKIEFDHGVPNVIEFWNEKGVRKVEKGKGKMHLYDSEGRFFRISGKIRSGKQHGKWKKTVVSTGLLINTEKYDEGVFKKGRVFSAMMGTEKYIDTSFCILELTPDYITAESFLVNRCFEVQDFEIGYATYPGGFSAFYDEVYQQLILSDIDYQLTRGKVIKIHVLIDEKGEMTSFNPITNYGIEDELINIMRHMPKWKPHKINGQSSSQGKVLLFKIY